jgi:hypothetical protein
MIIPSLEDRISTDENELQDNLSKINLAIKSKKDVSLKILNDLDSEISLDDEIGLEKIFEKFNRGVDLNIKSGKDLKKFVLENFDLSEKILKFLFVGDENTGKTWTLNFIKNLYKKRGKIDFQCYPTTR